MGSKKNNFESADATMSARGRGRAGRGRGSASSAARERKPADAVKQFPTPANVQKLSEYLHSLSESNFDTYGEAFASMVLSFSSDSSKLKEAVTLIFDHTVEDKERAPLGGRVCEKIICGPSQTDTRSEFRTCLLRRFQSEYQDKVSTRSHSIESWLGVFSFLCEIYVRVRVATGEPISVVGKAVLSSMEYMLQLQDMDDDELESVCCYLKECGSILQQLDQNRVDSIFTIMKKKLLSKNSSCRSRCLILEAIEYRLMGWSDPKGTLQNFYPDALADAIVEDELTQ